MGWTVEQIKALPRTDEGIFDFTGIGENLYQAAAEIYPVYAAYETDHNKKEGYPDIMAQMRVLDKKAAGEFSFGNASAYVGALLHTLEKISPEIYENYRELVDMLRAAVKRTLSEYYTAEDGFREGSPDEVKAFCDAIKEACSLDLLLAEKYQMCF
ncbi:MAG: hypothetical protein NC126_12135 [Clostridium sp.]|nr:hypothetical protein [Clostridium sp.]